MKRRIKAFFIATLSFIFPVSWRHGLRRRCHFGKLNSFDHPLFVKFLGLFFDVRTSVKGNVEFWFGEREKVKQKRRFRKLLKRIVAQ